MKETNPWSHVDFLMIQQQFGNLGVIIKGGMNKRSDAVVVLQVRLQCVVGSKEENEVNLKYKYEFIIWAQLLPL